MLPAFLVLFGMLAYGLSNVCWKPIIAEVSMIYALLVRSILTILMMAGITLVYRFLPTGILFKKLFFQHATDWVQSVLPAIFSILLSLLGLALFIYSVKFTPVGISGLLICCSALISAFLAWLIRGEAVPVFQIIAFILAISGVLLLDDTHAYKETSVKGLSLALGGAVCWGFANLGFKKYIPALGTLPFSMLQEIIVAIVMLLLVAFRLKINQEKQMQMQLLPKPIKLIFLVSCCTVVGVYCTNLGMSRLPVIFFSLLVLVQPITTLAVARLWLKEKLTFRQQIGCILVISGLFIGMIQP